MFHDLPAEMLAFSIDLVPAFGFFVQGQCETAKGVGICPVVIRKISTLNLDRIAVGLKGNEVPRARSNQKPGLGYDFKSELLGGIIDPLVSGIDAHSGVVLEPRELAGDRAIFGCAYPIEIMIFGVVRAHGKFPLVQQKPQGAAVRLVSF